MRTELSWALRLLVLVGAVLGVASAFAQKPKVSQSKEHHYFSKSDHKHETEWGYSGKIGPAHWGKLSPSYRLASTGKRQSPIDIELSKTPKRKLPALKFAYRKERLVVYNNGHTIQHDEKPGSFLHVGDEVYALEQFHVHLPSEHTINGRHSDMEIHFVHKSKSGKVAVVAVMVNAGRDKPVVVPPLSVPGKKGEKAVPFRGEVDPNRLIPSDHSYVTYQGSFTTPPCTEGVRWIVMTTPVRATATNITRLRKGTGGNNRPVQQRHDREILLSRGPSEDD